MVFKKCVFCNNAANTKDHVFPRAWYTDNTPKNIQRWTVPCCSLCNTKFGKLEQNLLVKLASCIDPNKVEMSGITKKLIETIKKRPHFLKVLLGKARPYTNKLKAFPGLGPHIGYSLDSQICIPVPTELIIVLEKIFRGAEYKLTSQYIEDPYKLKIYHIYEEDPFIIDLFHKWGKSVSLGPGFKIERASPPNLVRPAIYKATIWGTFISYASIDIKKT